MKTLASEPDLDEVRRRIATLNRDDRRRWGSMSASEMICHLRDAYEVPLGLRTAEDFKPVPLPRAVFKRLALHVPMVWPPNIQTPPEVDQRIGGTPPVDFASDLASLRARLDEFASLPQLIQPHPIFGKMTRSDWMRWGYLHADHHLRQFGR